VKNSLIVYHVSYLFLAWFCVYITPDNHDWLLFDGSSTLLIDLALLLTLLTYAFFFTLHFNVKKANIRALIILPLLLYFVANWISQYFLTYAHHITYLKLKYWFAGVYCALSYLVEVRIFKKAFINP
jgi:hypothetical protein